MEFDEYVWFDETPAVILLDTTVRYLSPFGV
jgi:hypothetical protein